MHTNGKWALDVGGGGWVRCIHPDYDRHVYLRLRPSDRDPERLSTYEAVMQSDRPISVHAWSQIPFAEIESAVGRDPAARRLIAAEHDCDCDGPSVHDFEHYFGEEHGEAHVRIGAAASPSGTVDLAEQPPALKRPQRLTDDFLKEVAAQYKWLTSVGELPGPTIAEQTGSPVRTAQRWVYEARKRGFLPPGRPGRTG